jgi:hypothetical protein
VEDIKEIDSSIKEDRKNHIEAAIVRKLKMTK